MKSTFIATGVAIALSYLTCSTNAIAFPGPKPTEAAILKLGLASPNPQVTSAPEVSKALLRPRAAGDNTCGFESGLPDGEYTCNNVARTCYFFTTAGVGARGCCSGDDLVNCGWLVDCIGLYDTASPRATDSFTLQCTNSNRPYCQSFTFPGNGVKDYGCGSVLDSTYRTILTTSIGQVKSASSVAIVTSKNVIKSKTIAIADPVSESGSSSSSSSSTSTSGPGPTSTLSSSEEKSKAPVGAIVGGVVGGLAFLGFLAAIVIFLLMRQKKKRAASDPTAAAASTPLAGGPASPAGAYSPQSNEKDYAQTQTNSYYGGNAGMQQQQYPQDGLLSPQLGYDQRSVSPAPGYSSDGFVSPQSTGQGYISSQPTGSDGHAISEAGGVAADKTAIPTHKNGEQIFEAPSGK
ncbi:MAG: hypothetical protein M1814_004989 [Vezdaea aestivalis]|nr:MAG: hypothetical protein M1814_004989 [Vezdaea aestivalis]